MSHEILTALIKIRNWCQVEGCTEQVQIADKAMMAAGIKDIPCFQCDGLGEWDEGPLPARSSAQISPEYRQVKCPECKGSGRVSLTWRWRCGNLNCGKVFDGPSNNYPGACSHCGFGGESLRDDDFNCQTCERECEGPGAFYRCPALTSPLTSKEAK